MTQRGTGGASQQGGRLSSERRGGKMAHGIDPGVKPEQIWPPPQPVDHVGAHDSGGQLAPGHAPALVLRDETDPMIPGA
jgi:hypothetical protein